MNTDHNTVQYILDLVKQDISLLEVQREDIIDRFITTGSWNERDINHGQLLGLAKVRGRLEAMLESDGDQETPEEKSLRIKLMIANRRIEDMRKDEFYRQQKLLEGA